MSGKRFRFSLQRVLEHRRRTTGEAEGALSQTRQARQAQEKRVAAARRQLHALQAQAPAPATTSLRGLRQHEARCQAARRACRNALTELDALLEREAAAQRRLLEARRNEESLTTLREQEHARHRKARAATEAAFLDEQAVMRHRRRQHALL